MTCPTCGAEPQIIGLCLGCYQPQIRYDHTEKHPWLRVEVIDECTCLGPVPQPDGDSRELGETQ